MPRSQQRWPVIRIAPHLHSTVPKLRALIGIVDKERTVDTVQTSLAFGICMSRLHSTVARLGPRKMSRPAIPTVPGAPKATGTANQDGTATLNWSAPDNGGSAVTAYNIYRSIKGGPFTLIATVPVTNYTDTGFATKDVYHVTAINQAGEGPYCPDVAPVRGVTQTPCVLPGVLAINDLNPDGTDNDGGANTPPDPSVNVRQLFVAEPDFGRDNNGNTIEKLVFTMQLAPSSAGSAPA